MDVIFSRQDIHAASAYLPPSLRHFHNLGMNGCQDTVESLAAAPAGAVVMAGAGRFFQVSPSRSARHAKHKLGKDKPDGVFETKATTFGSEPYLCLKSY